MIQAKDNSTKENTDKLFNYFYNTNYEMIKDIVNNYLKSKKEVTKDDIARTIDVLTVASIDNSHLDNIYVSNQTIEDIFKSEDTTAKDIMSGLTPMEREIINYSYGINNYDIKTLQEISKIYHEDYDFIVDVYQKAMEKMKAFYYCKFGCVDKNKGR